MSESNFLKRSQAILIALILVTLPGCVYTPTQGATPSMSVTDARHLIKNSLLHDPKTGGPAIVLVEGDNYYTIRNVLVTPTRFEVTISNGKKFQVNLKSARIQTMIDGVDPSWIFLDDLDLGFNSKNDNATVNHIADAFMALKVSASAGNTTNDNDQVRFDAVVKAYQAASPKPVLPEVARRFAVQAEGAAHDNDFDGAADYYEQALEIAPWWPEGHYDRAISLSGVNDFPDAIVEMQRYLALTPDAANARAVQDKIYDWQRKAPTGS